MIDIDTGGVGSVRKVVLTITITTLLIIVFGTVSATQLGLIAAPEIFDSDDDVSTLEAIPEDSNVIARFDVTGLENDETTMKVFENTSAEFLDHEEDVSQELFDLFTTKSTNETDVDLETGDINEIIFYGSYGIESVAIGSGYDGFIVDSDLDTDTMETLFMYENNTQTTEYRDVEIIQNQNATDSNIAQISDGIFVYGEMELIEDTIDTINGDNPSIDTEIVPDVEGDTHIHLIAHDMNNLYDIVDFSDSDSLPVPNSASISYTTNDEDQIMVDIVTSSENASESLDIAEYTSENLNTTDEFGYDMTIETTDMNIRYEATPEEVEDLFSIISGDFGLGSELLDDSIDGMFNYEEHVAPEIDEDE